MKTLNRIFKEVLIESDSKITPDVKKVIVNRNYTLIYKFIKSKFNLIKQTIFYRSLLKRQWIGTHHHYSIKYMQGYIDEMSFRQNNRGEEKAFDKLLKQCDRKAA
jgi:hypothetical protein